MLLATLPLLLLLHSATSPDAPTDAAKGASLYRGCQAELRLMQPEGVVGAAQGDLVNGSYCVGYLNGFIANLDAKVSTLCTEDQPMGALVRAYVTYMEQNPGYLEQDKRIGVRLALQSSFGCPSPASTGSQQAVSQRHRL